MLKNLSRPKRILICVGCILFVGILLFCLLYFDVGGYYDTPLEALDAEKDACTLYTGSYLSDELFSVHELIDIIDVEDVVKILYVSKADTFCLATCKYNNSRKKWSYRSLWHHDSIEGTPYGYIYQKGDPLEDVGSRRENTVWGLKIVDGSILYVNGVKSNVKKYDFYFKGKNQEIEFWYVENIFEEDYTVESR